MGDISFNILYPKFTHHISTQDTLLPLYIVKSLLDHDINTWGLNKNTNILRKLETNFLLKKLYFLPYKNLFLRAS